MTKLMLSDEQKVSIIRTATSKDIPQIVSLTQEFFFESLYDYGFTSNITTLFETAKNLIDNHILLVAEKEKIIGVIAGIVFNSLFDKSQTISQELVWYVKKEERGTSAGVRLLKAFEKQSKEKLANKIIMVHMNNLYTEPLKRFYRKNNYRLMEEQYIKEV